MFFTFLQERQAVPQAGETVAHIVRRPRREGKQDPIAIFWPWEVWTILANLQNLETVWYVSLGVYAGLHTTEIRRLVWENVTWDPDHPDNPKQIQIPSGKGKDSHGAGDTKYIDVVYPLTEILRLGKGRSGAIVSNNSTWESKLQPLLARLQIA